MSHHLDPASPTNSFGKSISLPLLSRASLSTTLAWASRLGLLLTMALSAWRYRWILLPQASPPVYQDYTNLLLFPSDLVLLLSLAAWSLSRWFGGGSRTRGPLFLSLPLAGLLLVSWLSVPFSVDPTLSFYHSVRLLILGGLYLLALDQIRDLGALALAAGLLILSQVPLGLVQLLRQQSMGLQQLGEHELNPAWLGVSVVATGGTRLLRAYGLTDHPNLLGGALAFSLVLVSAGFIHGRRPWRTLYAALFGLGLVGLLATFSRSAAAGLAVGMAIYGLLLWRRGAASEIREWLVLMLAGILILAPFLAAYAPFVGARSGVADSFENEPTERRSLQERAALNQATTAIFAEQALTGVGVGALPLAMQDRFPDFPYYFQPAHLVLLEVAAETGIFGAVLFALAMVLPWAALSRLVRRRQRLSHGLIASSALLAALTIVGLLDYYPWLLQPGRLWLWLGWGVWAGQYTDALQGGSDD